MRRVSGTARSVSLKINKLVEVACVALLVLLVLDVWLGVLLRYVIPLPWTFTEELARYLMIWMALLAVSSGIVHREHIGVEFVFGLFPARWRRALAIAFDLLAFTFFALLFWYGLEFVERGFRRQTMVFDMPKAYPFMGVPLASALACIQLLLTAIHDLYAETAPRSTGDAIAGLGGDARTPSEK